MSLLYSKLRLQIPQVSDGKNAIITSPRGVNRSVPMTYPLTDVFVGGMDKYTVQAGTGSETFSVGNGKLKKIVTEDASALTIVSMPTKTRYTVGHNLDLSGIAIDATISKGDGTSTTRDVTNLCNYSPPNGTTLNTVGEQRIDINYESANTFFNVTVSNRIYLKKLPYNFSDGGAVVLNNEIHILGGTDNGTKHYKWNGTSWSSVSTLPRSFIGGAVVVLNNEIHLLGGSGNTTAHHKWNGTSWSSVSTLPYPLYRGCAVVYNGEIHIMGTGSSSSYYKSHYKWNGTSWSSVSTLPYNFYGGSAVVYNGEIHILGGDSSVGTSYIEKYHYKWNGTSWDSLTSFPTSFFAGASAVYNNNIFILGSGYNPAKYFYWNGSSYSNLLDLPYDLLRGCAVIYNDELVILGTGLSGEDAKSVAQYDGYDWVLATQ